VRSTSRESCLHLRAKENKQRKQKTTPGTRMERRERKGSRGGRLLIWDAIYKAARPFQADQPARWMILRHPRAKVTSGGSGDHSRLARWGRVTSRSPGRSRNLPGIPLSGGSSEGTLPPLPPPQKKTQKETGQTAEEQVKPHPQAAGREGPDSQSTYVIAATKEEKGGSRTQNRRAIADDDTG